MSDDKLLKQVRQFLNITWEDESLDSMLSVYIESSKEYLRGIAGKDNLDFESEGLANDLLLNRVLYMNSHQLNDFNTNYQGMLNELRILNHGESS